MTRSKVNHVAAILPLVLSAAAFLLVTANVIAGVQPQPDENASAHMWQLLMAAQVPLLLLYAATADWRGWKPATWLGLQLLAIAIACVPVWLMGY